MKFNCYGDGNIYRGMRTKPSSIPTYIIINGKWVNAKDVSGTTDDKEGEK